MSDTETDLNEEGNVATLPEVDDKVDLPNDIQTKTDNLPDDLALFLTDQYKKKKEANNEAKQLRLEKEELLNSMSEKEDEIKQQYEQKLSEWEGKYNSLLNEMKQKKAEKAKAELDLAVQKHKAADSETVEALLSRHLKSIQNDSEKMNEFNIDSWMTGLKETKSFLFESEQVTNPSPANFGVGSGTKDHAESGLRPNDKVSANEKDKQELEGDWASFTSGL